MNSGPGSPSTCVAQTQKREADGSRSPGTGTALPAKPVLSLTLPGPSWELLVLLHPQAQRRHEKCGRARTDARPQAEWGIPS